MLGLLGLLGLLAGRFGFLALLEAGLKHGVSHARRQDGSADYVGASKTIGANDRFERNGSLHGGIFMKSLES